MKFTITVLVCISFFIMYPFAAFAEPSGINQSPETKAEKNSKITELEAEYNQAIKNLTPEQLDYLSYLDKEWAATMDPDAQILDTGAQLEPCMKSDSDMLKKQKEYTDAFIKWRDVKNTEQEKMWAAHRALRKKVDFIDRKILDGHMAFQAKLMLQMIYGMNKIATDVKKVDCTKVKETLKDYM